MPFTIELSRTDIVELADISLHCAFNDRVLQHSSGSRGGSSHPVSRDTAAFLPWPEAVRRTVLFSCRFRRLRHLRRIPVC